MVDADAAERGAGQHAHIGLREQPLRELGTAQPGSIDVREGVEGTHRRLGLDAGDGVEARDDEVAPRLELHDHRVDIVLRAGQRRHGTDDWANVGAHEIVLMTSSP